MTGIKNKCYDNKRKQITTTTVASAAVENTNEHHFDVEFYFPYEFICKMLISFSLRLRKKGRTRQLSLAYLLLLDPNPFFSLFSEINCAPN